jgi:hypothetical protein
MVRHENARSCQHLQRADRRVGFCLQQSTGHRNLPGVLVSIAVRGEFVRATHPPHAGVLCSTDCLVCGIQPKEIEWDVFHVQTLSSTQCSGLEIGARSPKLVVQISADEPGRLARPPAWRGTSFHFRRLHVPLVLSILSAVPYAKPRIQTVYWRLHGP